MSSPSAAVLAWEVPLTHADLSEGPSPRATRIDHLARQAEALAPILGAAIDMFAAGVGITDACETCGLSRAACNGWHRRSRPRIDNLAPVGIARELRVDEHRYERARRLGIVEGRGDFDKLAAGARAMGAKCGVYDRDPLDDVINAIARGVRGGET